MPSLTRRSRPRPEAGTRRGYAGRVAAQQSSREQTKASRVHASLREAILSGELRPGDRLRQQEVALRWRVSATPVREAFRRLEVEGLVAYAANRGVVVRERPEASLATLAQNWSALVEDPQSVPGSDFP